MSDLMDVAVIISRGRHEGHSNVYIAEDVLIALGKLKPRNEALRRAIKTALTNDQKEEDNDR